LPTRSLQPAASSTARRRPGLEGGFGVPLAAFTFAHGGPRIDTPRPRSGQHNEEIFAELGVGREPRREAGARQG
jgi:hypothetical protein